MSTKVCTIALVLFLVGLCTAEQEQLQNLKNNVRKEMKKSYVKECVSSYSIKCLKLDVVYWLDKLSEKKDYALLPGVSVVRENTSEVADIESNIINEVSREFPKDPDARLDAYIMKKLSGYLNSHSVKLNLWNNNEVEEGRGKGGGGGGGKKGGGGMEYILAAGAMMKATWLAISLGGLGALAWKALMTATLSLLLSGIIGVKALTHHDDHKSTHEVIAKPIYVSHDDGGGGHYRRSSYPRSLDVPLPLGLQPGYKPT